MIVKVLMRLLKKYVENLDNLILKSAEELSNIL